MQAGQYVAVIGGAAYSDAGWALPAHARRWATSLGYPNAVVYPLAAAAGLAPARPRR